MKKTINIALILTMIFAFANIVKAQERTVKVVKGGKVVYSVARNEVDYMTIVNKMPTPKNIKVSNNGGSISLQWDKVNGAISYKIHRSPDDKNYTEIGNTTTNTYTDKSPNKGLNYYKVQAVRTDDIYSELSDATLPIWFGNKGESGVYLGIIGFNQSLYEYPISRLSASNKSDFYSFIDRLTTKNGTLLYYSAEQALNTLQSGAYPSDLFNVALVTFTDGLDQGSFMMNSKYDSDDEYLNAINYRIRNEKVAGYPINAYSIGIRSTDVSDVNKFSQNLKKLASKDENAKEVTSMSEVNKKFQEIAQQLVENNSFQTVTLKIPGPANGTRIRFTFDNVSSGNNSNLYIEGVFNLTDKSLTNITYKGFATHPGSTIKGSQDGIFVSFTFEGVQTESKKLITKDYINEWTYITSTSSWQINSEFEKTPEAAKVETKYRSAVVMLVLDCSSSLGSNFSNVQSHAKNFIDILLNGLTN